MRAVVVGGSGQIGGWLLRVLAERGHEAIGTYHSVAYPGLEHLDAAEADRAARWLEARRPEVVFYPAGYTYVDGCQRDPARALAANRDQPLNLALAAQRAGARFVYFSTDYVFDGRQGPYDEEAPTNALSAYGRSKREAEQALSQSLGERALIVRTSWVFGPERQGKNFAYQLVRTLRKGQTLACPSDMFSSPSYAPDVARAAVVLAEGGHSGIIHVAGPEVMSRAEFARRLAAGFGLDPAAIVTRPNAELPQAAPRPLSGGLLTPRLDAIAPGIRRPIAPSRADFLARLEAREGWLDPRGEASEARVLLESRPATG